MKNRKGILMAVIIAVTGLITGCAKDKTNGNTKVVEYLYHDESLSATHDILKKLPYLPSALDSITTLVYYFDHRGNAWYSSPGLGAYGSYQTRHFFAATTHEDSIAMTLHITDSTGAIYTGAAVTLDKLKIVVMSDYTVHSGKRDEVDYSDYKATMKYLGLKE